MGSHNFVIDMHCSRYNFASEHRHKISTINSTAYKYARNTIRYQEPGSSVNIVSDYGLDDRAIEVRSPAEAKGFSCSLSVQTSSGTHPGSCTMAPGVLTPGVNRGRGVTLTTHPHLLPRSRMNRSYISSSLPKRLRGV
jgi:hypothetical protein